MPIIDLPVVGKVQFDDTLNSDQLKGQMQQLADRYGFEMPKPDLTFGEKVGRGFSRGVDDASNLVTNVIPAMGASALGYDEYAKDKLAQASERQQQSLLENAPQYGDLDNVHNPLEFGGWGVETLAENIPTILTALIPGVGAEAIASRVAMRGITKTLMEQAVKKGLEGEAKDAFLAGALAEAAPRMASNKATIGHIGTYLGAYTQSAPDTFQRVYEKTGELAPQAAAIYGAGQAALNSILPARLAASLSPSAKAGIVANLMTKSGMEPGLVQHITGGILREAGVQGAVEGATEALTASAEKFVAGNPQIFDSDDWHRVMKAAVAGAVVGAPFGVITGGSDRLGQRSESVAADHAVNTDPGMMQPEPINMPEVPTGPDIGPASGLLPEVAKATTIRTPDPRQMDLLPEGIAVEPKSQIEVNQQRLMSKREGTAVKQSQKALMDRLNSVSTRIDDLLGTGESPTKNIDSTISEADFSNMGIGKTNKNLRSAILGKDLNDPVQRAFVTDKLQDYANNPIRSSELGNKVIRYLDSERFAREQGDRNDTGLNDTPVGEGASMDIQPGPGELPGGIEDVVGDRHVPAYPDATGIDDRAKQLENTLVDDVQTSGIPTRTAIPEEGVLEKLYNDPNVSKESIVSAAKTLANEGRINQDGLSHVLGMAKDEAIPVAEVAQGLQKAVDGFRLWLPAAKGADLTDLHKGFIANNDATGLISSLASTATNPDIQRILTKFNKMGVSPHIEVGSVGGDKAGMYDPNTHTIRVDPNMGLNEHTLLHEMTHAAISKVLDSPQHPLTKDFSKFFKQVKQFVGDTYGGSDLQEFAAEFVGNPEFQSLLKTIKAPKSGNMFKRIIQSIAEFLGFSKGQSAYEKSLKFVNDAIDISGDVKPHPADVMYLGNGDAFNSVGDIGKAMPKLAGRTIDQMKNTFSNIKEAGLFKASLGPLNLDNINTLFGEFLPGLKRTISSVERKSGYTQNEFAKVDSVLSDATKAKRKFPSQFKAMEKLAIDARLAKIDLLDPDSAAGLSNSAEYIRLKKVWDGLDPSVRNVYTNIRRGYEKAHKDFLDTITDNLNPSDAAKLRAEYEAEPKVVAYVPFSREGDYKLDYLDSETAERVAVAFKSIRERDQYIEQNLKGRKDYREYKDIQKMSYSSSDMPPTAAITKIMKALDESGASKDQMDSAYQAYLELFPAQSIGKNFIHAKNVKGMNEDILNSYANTMGSWVTRLAKSKFDPEIDKAANEIKSQASEPFRVSYVDPATGKKESAGFDTEEARKEFVDTELSPNNIESNLNQIDPNKLYSVAEHVLSQTDFFHNPTYGKLTNFLSAGSYFLNLAGNVSSAVINLTTIPLMTLPILAARHGIHAASTEIARAGKIAINKNWGKDTRYADLFKVASEHDQLSHTLAVDLSQRRKGHVDDIHSLAAKVFQWSSVPFSASEKYNRSVALISAYELALKGDVNGRKMNKQEAIDYAMTTSKEMNTSGLGATAPKWMQNGLGRTFFTFKKYAWNQAFVIARAFHQAFKGEDPAIRRMAQRQLIGTFGMAMAFGGIKGLPFFTAASTMADMLNALFGDDDEPFDLGQNMRGYFGDLLYKGPVNYFTNLELSNRSGAAQNLVYQDDPESLARDGLALMAFKQAAGPAGAYLMNNTKMAAEQFQQGHTARSIETLLPAALRNPLKALRFAAEGAETLGGHAIQEDVSLWNSAMQGIGFTPADLSNTYEKRAVVKNIDNKIGRERKLLMNKYELGKTSGDSELVSDSKKNIAEFNKRHPAVKISQDTLSKSIQAHEQQQKNFMYGVRFNPKLLPELQKIMEE